MKPQYLITLAIIIGGGIGLLVWFRALPGKAVAPPDLGHGFQLIPIPAGSFRYGTGDIDDPPVRDVRIDKRFYLGAHEVTQEQWQAIMGVNPSRFQGADRPVENVSWEDARAFCERLSKRSGHKVRLPTEEEWEYACRAGTAGRYSFGERLRPDQATFKIDEGAEAKGTTPVGRYLPNAWGLYDMHGNVWEWCSDEDRGEAGLRVVRGGAWLFEDRDCRSGSREGFLPTTRCDFVGFRIAVEAR